VNLFIYSSRHAFSWKSTLGNVFGFIVIVSINPHFYRVANESREQHITSKMNIWTPSHSLSCVLLLSTGLLSGCGRQPEAPHLDAAPSTISAGTADDRVQQERLEGQKTETLNQAHRIGRAAMSRMHSTGGKAPSSIADLEEELGGLSVAIASDYSQKLPMGFSMWSGQRKMKWIEENSSKRLPEGLSSWEKGRKADWLRQNASFVLLPAAVSLMDPKAAQTILVFEKLQFATQASVAICYCDTSARTTPTEKANAQILAQTGRSLAEWSGLK
jgi:hypothetical protein